MKEVFEQIYQSVMREVHYNFYYAMEVGKYDSLRTLREDVGNARIDCLLVVAREMCLEEEYDDMKYLRFGRNF